MQREAKWRTPMMHSSRKSNSREVPRKPSNEAGQPVALVVVVGRRLTKREPHASKTQLGHRAGRLRRVRWSGVRQITKRDKQMRFTALLHHILCLERLRAADLAAKQDAAPGVPGEYVAVLRRGARVIFKTWRPG